MLMHISYIFSSHWEYQIRSQLFFEDVHQAVKQTLICRLKYLGSEEPWQLELHCTLMEVRGATTGIFFSYLACKWQGLNVVEIYSFYSYTKLTIIGHGDQVIYRHLSWSWTDKAPVPVGTKSHSTESMNVFIGTTSKNRWSNLLVYACTKLHRLSENFK